MIRALDSSDATLLKLYKKDKNQGLELLYDRYKKYIYTIAYHYAGNKEDALDLTQDVFLSIFKSLDRFDDSFSMLPWIKRITVNKCLNYLRDKKDALSLNQHNENGHEIQELLPSSNRTEEATLYLDTKETLVKAIHALPSEERMAIILRHMKGMKYEEIAKIMGVPLGTVKTYLYRGRKNLKTCLSKDGLWER
ncbi:RNA polymerase sigma factor [Desulfitobacterium dehalogenans]|uniref:RNA polymerase sigma factor n=1 Tax=Desulfitobacterium dehalogenans TaxID=36854 RepID=UPI00155A55F4|nr:sigma-70 family RNA polymerase sigma factor [Desulfitobacterium dehalogenans]